MRDNLSGHKTGGRHTGGIRCLPLFFVLTAQGGPHGAAVEEGRAAGYGKCVQDRAEDQGRRGAGEDGDQMQPRRAGFPGSCIYKGRDQETDRPRQHPLLRSAGHPSSAQGGCAAPERNQGNRGGAGEGRRLSRRQAPDRPVPAGLLRRGGRGDLSQPRLPDLRVVHEIRRRQARPHPPSGGHWILPLRRGHCLRNHAPHEDDLS